MHGEPKLRAVTHPTLHAHHSAHHLGQTLADREPQAGPPVFPCRGGVELAERLEQAADPVRRDADAGVPDGEGQLVDRARGVEVLRRHRQHHFARLGELQGIAEEVQENLPQSGDVAHDRRRRIVGNRVGEIEPLLSRSCRYEVQRCLHTFAEVERLGLEVHPPRLDLTEVQHVVDDGQQGVPARADDLRVVALLLGQLGVQQEAAHPDHRVHGGPDLVTHRGEERALGLVGALGIAPCGHEIAEEAGVLDGQHRLGGEGPKRGNDLRRERASLATHDHQAAEQPVFPDQRNRDERAHAFPGENPAHLGGHELPVFDVGDHDGFPDDSGPADRPLAEPDRRRP